MDVTAITARLEFDCIARMARAEASLHFTVDDSIEPPVFDLRQRIETATLDGEVIDPTTLLPTAEEIRQIDGRLEDGEHELALTYELRTPAATESVPIGWTLQRPGVMFDFWMSDLHPGRYLEMWLPAPLCHDRFGLDLDISVVGGPPHRVFANGSVQSKDGTGFQVSYPPHYTSLSPMLVIVPDGRYDLISTDEDGMAIDTFKLAGPEIDLAACHVTVGECLAHNGQRFGLYDHGDRFLTYVWGSGRGMEYDGATTASVGSLEHEVFHSWFGRGVKPASANDGWIDEAFTTWYTSAPPRPRQWTLPFDWAEPPVRLRPSATLARYTPREAYGAGARLFAGLASLLGVDGLCDSMGRLYRQRAGGFLSTDELEVHLSEAAGHDLARAFARWVHGYSEAP